MRYVAGRGFHMAQRDLRRILVASEEAPAFPDGREVFLKKFGHALVAGAAGVAAEDDGDEFAAAAVGRADQVETRSPGVAGLDAVDAFDPAEQLVVVGVGLAVVAEGLGVEILEAAREVVLQGLAEDGHVARRRHLGGIGQA